MHHNNNNNKKCLFIEHPTPPTKTDSRRYTHEVAGTYTWQQASNISSRYIHHHSDRTALSHSHIKLEKTGYLEKTTDGKLSKLVSYL